MNNNLVEVKDLKLYFPVKAGIFRRTVGQIKAVDGVTFDIPRGKTVGLVGESGCGKTTTGRTLVGLYKATGGTILFDGKNIDALEDSTRKNIRKRFQMVFQDPYGSLNPRIPIGDIIAEGADIHKLYETKSQRKELIESLMDKTGLDPAYINRYAHEFSGGQRQRIGIARALALNPEVIILDEPVSALDVSIQVQILELLNKLQDELGLTYLFIAHDLSVVEYFSEYVAVMYLGKIVEIADRETLYAEKSHPYTQALISAVPVPDPLNKRTRIILSGDVPSPMAPPPGCPFHPRCPHTMERCLSQVPPTVEKEPGHKVSCWLYA